MAQQVGKRALNVVVLLGTVRDSNMGSRAAKFMVNQLSSKGHQVKLLGKLKRGRGCPLEPIACSMQLLPACFTFSSLLAS